MTMENETDELRGDAPDHARNPHPDEPAEAVERPEAAERANTAGALDAVRAAETTRRRDASTPERTRGRGVEWVRPTDLIARQTGTLAGRGIDFQAELSRRTRTSMVTRARNLGDRARRLPPLSAFGRANTARTGPARSGFGFGMS